MNTERSKKMLETMRQRRQEFKAQTIHIDKDWCISRLDEMNWEIQYKGQFRGYYGRLINALQALPHKMLSSRARGSIEEILATMKAVEADVAKAVRIQKLADA